MAAESFVKHGHVTAKGYLLTWAVLLTLTTATLLVSFVAHGVWEYISGLGFAVVKASLVAWFFMHLVEERFSSRVSFLVGVLFVILIVGLVVADVVTRQPIEVQVPSIR